jgi:hypothetical protein
MLRGQQAHIWSLRERHGEKTNVYSFYAAEDGTPLRLYMMGRNIIQVGGPGAVGGLCVPGPR